MPLQSSQSWPYREHSRTRWLLVKEEYKLRPADSSSDRNNINLDIWNGRSLYEWDSPDFLLRDEQWHLLTELDRTVLKGQSYVRSTTIFDKFGSDKSCDTKIGF